MRKRNIFAMFAIIFFFIALFAGGLFAGISDDLQPSSPPPIPAADFSPDGKVYMDLMYMRIKTDDLEFNGGGFGINYVSMANTVGWNVGFNFFYLSGGDNDGIVEGGMVSPSFTANLAIRPYGTAESNNLILFGGLHYSYANAWLTINDDTDVEINLWMYGPMAGAKTQIPLKKGINLIPFYVFKYHFVDNTTYVEGVEQGIDMDPFVSHIIGFDLEIGKISIGTLLDMFSDNDMIMFHLSFKF